MAQYQVQDCKEWSVVVDVARSGRSGKSLFRCGNCEKPREAPRTSQEPKLQLVYRPKQDQLFQPWLCLVNYSQLHICRVGYLTHLQFQRVTLIVMSNI